MQASYYTVCSMRPSLNKVQDISLRGIYKKFRSEMELLHVLCLLSLNFECPSWIHSLWSRLRGRSDRISIWPARFLYLTSFLMVIFYHHLSLWFNSYPSWNFHLNCEIGTYYTIMSDTASNVEQLSIQDHGDFELVKFIISAEEKLGVLDGRVKWDIDHATETTGTLICDLTQPLDWDQVRQGLKDFGYLYLNDAYIICYYNMAIWFFSYNVLLNCINHEDGSYVWTCMACLNSFKSVDIYRTHFREGKCILTCLPEVFVKSIADLS